MKNLLFICVVLLFSACKYEPIGEVEFQISCYPAGFDVTYRNDSGDIVQETLFNETWSYDFIGERKDHYYATAQSNHDDSHITIKVFYQGKEIKKSESYGDHVVVVVDDYLP